MRFDLIIDPIVENRESFTLSDVRETIKVRINTNQVESQ